MVADGRFLTIAHEKYGERFEVIDPKSDWTAAKVHAAEAYAISKQFDYRLAKILSGCLWPTVQPAGSQPQPDWAEIRKTWLDKASALREFDKSITSIKADDAAQFSRQLIYSHRIVISDYLRYSDAYLELMDSGDCNKFDSKIADWAKVHPGSPQFLSLACADPIHNNPEANRSYARVHREVLWYEFARYLETFGLDSRIKHRDLVLRENGIKLAEDTGD